MNSRTIAAIIIVTFAIGFLLIVGTKTAKFANNYAESEQNRIDAAFAVLDR
jgi:hypothetical protein